MQEKSCRRQPGGRCDPLSAARCTSSCPGRSFRTRHRSRGRPEAGPSLRAGAPAGMVVSRISQGRRRLARCTTVARFVHTYFYPAEQYDRGPARNARRALPRRMGRSRHSSASWMSCIPTPPKTPGSAYRIPRPPAFRHRCLAFEEGSTAPRYAFVHGNFALANCAAGRDCGVDSEMQILAETGCYADLTMPDRPLASRANRKTQFRVRVRASARSAAPHRKGNDLAVGRVPANLSADGARSARNRSSSARLRSLKPALENGGFTGADPHDAAPP